MHSTVVHALEVVIIWEFVVAVMALAILTAFVFRRARRDRVKWLVGLAWLLTIVTLAGGYVACGLMSLSYVDVYK